MAERRMFARSIVESDAFLDMPLSARCLYFAFGMDADDDGFVGNPKSVMRQASATQDDLKLLIAKRFVLSFESGVIVIKHWRINNYIQKDRYKSTTYVEELNTLALDDKGAYTEKTNVYPKCIQNGYKMDTQYSIGKYRDSMNEYKDINIKDNNAHTRESYEDIIDNMCLEDDVRPILSEFIKHCRLNGRTLTNAKLEGILVYMDCKGYSVSDKIKALSDAINGGYFDIKRQ